MIALVTGSEVTFWVVAPLMVLGALGLLFFRKAVYAALSMAFVMVNLAVLYASLNAMFLTFVQIIVYTGAIMMLFLFVLMLVGVGHHADSVVETIPGQRWLAGVAGLGLLGLIVFGIGGALQGGPAVGLDGMALVMVLLTVLLVPLVLLAEWKVGGLGRWPAQAYVGLVLALESLSLFVFMAEDVLLFYLFFEATLIPMYFLIGGFGGARRSYAAVSYTHLDVYKRQCPSCSPC